MSSNIDTICARHGTFHVYRNDTVIGRSMSRYGEWAEAEVALFQKLLRPGDIVVEAGANIGVHTVPIARTIGPEGVIHAFEPAIPNHQLLCANIVANGLDNILTYQCALGSSAQVVEFPLLDPRKPDNFGAFGLFADTTRKAICPVLSIDLLSLSRLDLLKIDVEGAEREVIAGASKTIERCRPILFVESLNIHASQLAPDGHSSWLVSALAPLDYACWHYITPLFNAQNWQGNAENDFPGKWSFDMLCVPRERGRVTGLPDAGTDSMHVEDVDQWRGIQIVR